MGMIYKELARGLVVPTTLNTAQTMYTNPTTVDTVILRIAIYNVHTSAVVIYIGSVPDTALIADDMDAADYYHVLTIPGASTFEVDTKIAMVDTNETIQAWASVASKIYLKFTGFTMTDQS